MYNTEALSTFTMLHNRHHCSSPELLTISNKDSVLGRPGGSAVGRLPSAQGMILESPAQVPHRAPGIEPASPSAYLSLSLMNK